MKAFFASTVWNVELISLSCAAGRVGIQALTGGDPPLVTIGNVIVANFRAMTLCWSARWKTPTIRA